MHSACAGLPGSVWHPGPRGHTHCWIRCAPPFDWLPPWVGHPCSTTCKWSDCGKHCVLKCTRHSKNMWHRLHQHINSCFKVSSLNDCFWKWRCQWATTAPGQTLDLIKVPIVLLWQRLSLWGRKCWFTHAGNNNKHKDTLEFMSKMFYCSHVCLSVHWGPNLKCDCCDVLMAAALCSLPDFSGRFLLRLLMMIITVGVAKNEVEASAGRRSCSLLFIKWFENVYMYFCGLRTDVVLRRSSVLHRGLVHRVRLCFYRHSTHIKK